MQKKEFPKEIALCLSGGAAKGAYHLGAINILQKSGVAIKAISGTSIGAVIGAALASGKSAEEIFEIFSSREYREIFKFSMREGALFRVEQEAEILEWLIPCRDFKELDIPLSVTLTDIMAAEPHYISSGDLRSAVLASSSISPLLPPVRLNGVLYSDGGLVDNFPLEQLQEFSYPIVGINLYPNNPKIPTTIFGWLKKNIRIAWQKNNFAKAKLCDYYLTNNALDNVRAFSFSDIGKGYALGEADMRRVLDSKEII